MIHDRIYEVKVVVILKIRANSSYYCVSFLRHVLNVSLSTVTLIFNYIFLYSIGKREPHKCGHTKPDPAQCTGMLLLSFLYYKYLFIFCTWKLSSRNKNKFKILENVKLYFLIPFCLAYLTPKSERQKIKNLVMYRKKIPKYYQINVAMFKIIRCSFDCIFLIPTLLTQIYCKL